MHIETEELVAILGQFNPWWRGEPVSDLPEWHRAAFKELQVWITNPPAHRAIFLSGARQVGKTTLLMQAIASLIESRVPPANILYATFDHPLFKLAGIDKVLSAWREREPKREGPEYIFLDEAQFIRDHGTWIKHQVDFHRQRQIIFTGSAMPILQADQESGVGRWHNIRLTTLSFYEYLQLKKISIAKPPRLRSLRDLFEYPDNEIRHIAETSKPLLGHFHTYLLHGGFPQTALIASVTQAQKLLREDIIDKAIKRDMTALFGVRRVLDLEQTFLYLCLHDGGILDLSTLAKNLQVSRPTAQSFIELLEATHLIYRLQPFGYGKEVLRGRYKVYLADAAIAPAVMLKGHSFIEDPVSLSVAAEASVIKHLFSRHYRQNIRFTYWRGKKDLEVDLVAELSGQIIPFEVKYRSSAVAAKDTKGILAFCTERGADRGYVVTKSLDDFGLCPPFDPEVPKIFRVPATLLCYWMGEMEISAD